MPNNTPHGQIDDNAVYTHKRLAVIFGRSEAWVMKNIINPPLDPRNDGPPRRERPGVPCLKIGAMYLVSGHHFRLWVETLAKLQYADEAQEDEKGTE